MLLARTLMSNPALWLLDEPTAGLDLGGREQLVAMLGAVAADAGPPSIVMVTHHVEEIPPRSPTCCYWRVAACMQPAP